MNEQDIKKYIESCMTEIKDENIKQIRIHEKICDIKKAIQNGFIDPGNLNMLSKDLFCWI